MHPAITSAMIGDFTFCAALLLESTQGCASHFSKEHPVPSWAKIGYVFYSTVHRAINQSCQENRNISTWYDSIHTKYANNNNNHQQIISNYHQIPREPAFLPIAGEKNACCILMACSQSTPASASGTINTYQSQVARKTFPHFTLHSRTADGIFASRWTSPSLALPHSGPSISSCCGPPCSLQGHYLLI